jgi:hypothetical protein
VAEIIQLQFASSSCNLSIDVEKWQPKGKGRLKLTINNPERTVAGVTWAMAEW